MLDQLTSKIKFKHPASESKTHIRLLEVEYHFHTHQFLSQLQLYLDSNHLGSLSIITALGADIDISTPFNTVNEGIITLKIEKSNIHYFVSEQGFADFLKKEKSLKDFKKIGLIFINKIFSTLSTVFTPLKDISGSHESTNHDDDISPIKIVKPINAAAQNFLPDSIKSWLITTSNQQDVPDSWKVISSQKMLSTLCNEFSIENQHFILEFRGDQRRQLSIKSSDETMFLDLYAIIYSTYEWVYYQSKDIDSRHSLFTHHMAQLLNDGQRQIDKESLKLKLLSARENSKLAYSYYLSNASKELNKSLSELNKTLFDYHSKIRQNISDLSFSLWRDFSTAMGIMALNFSIKKPDMIDQYYTYFAVAIAIYVSLSFIISSTNGFYFYYGLKKNLNDWRTRLYSYMSQEDYEKLCIIPLKSSFKKFRTYFFVIMIAYMVLIVSILLCSFIQSKDKPSELKTTKTPKAIINSISK